MKKIVDWINTHKIITICITLFLFVVQPIVVHWMFKTPAATTFWVKTWEAGDLLGYIAGFEAFIGTVFLGAVAARQNDKANDINERLLNLEDKQNLFYRQPSISISTNKSEVLTTNSIFGRNGPTYCYSSINAQADYTPEFWDQKYTYLSLKLKNLTPSSITINLAELKICSFSDEDEYIEYEQNPISFHAKDVHLFPQQEVDLGFILGESNMESNLSTDGSLKLYVFNSLGEQYIYKMKFLIVPCFDGKFGIYVVKQDFTKANIASK